jgi:hypothetical protein
LFLRTGVILLLVFVDGTIDRPCQFFIIFEKSNPDMPTLADHGDGPEVRKIGIDEGGDHLIKWDDDIFSFFMNDQPISKDIEDLLRGLMMQKHKIILDHQRKYHKKNPDFQKNRRRQQMKDQERAEEDRVKHQQKKLYFPIMACRFASEFLFHASLQLPLHYTMETGFFPPLSGQRKNTGASFDDPAVPKNPAGVAIGSTHRYKVEAKRAQIPQKFFFVEDIFHYLIIFSVL